MADDKSGSKKDDLRQQILDLTAQYYDEAFPKKPFLGGISQIPVSGKVFDGDELKKFGTWHSSDKDKFAGVTLNYDERWLIYSLMNTSGMGHYVRCIKNI